MSEVISQITKNAREVVFLSLSEFKGRRLIDIRVHVPGDEEGNGFPPAKGSPWRSRFTRPSSRDWPQLEKALIQQGLLDPEDLEAAE